MMTFLLRLRKGDLLEVARELGVEVIGDQTKVEIKDMILQNDMETIKAVMEGILEEKEREFEERRQTREYELELLRLSNATETISVSSADLEGQGVNRRVNLKDLVPKFDGKNADINLFFEIFERQAKKEKVSDDRWVSQLIPLLPVESTELIAKEPPEKRRRLSSHKKKKKKLILNRFQLTPVALRDRKLVGRNGNKIFAGVKRIVSDRAIKKRAPIEVVDHFIDAWDNFKDATELAEKLDHFEAVKKERGISGKRVQTKRDSQREWERPFERKKPIICYYCNEVGHIKPSCPRLTKNNAETVANLKVNSGNEEPFRNSEFQGTSQIRGSEREWERPFERKKSIICYYCNEVGHIKPACPKLMKTDFETVASLRVNLEDEDYFEKIKVKFEINGVDCQCLRDTGSTIGLCASSWIDENDYLGEYVLVKSPLDDECHRLPLAKVKFKTKGGEFYTKAAVKVNSHPSEPYLLSNRTAELIQSREKNVLMIDAMLTQNASKIVPFEKEREAESETRGKASSERWRYERSLRLSSSFFKEIACRKKSTPCSKLVMRIVYGRDLCNAALKYGLANEEIARKQYERKYSTEVKICGLFVDKDKPFLCASPDGLVVFPTQGDGTEPTIEVPTFVEKIEGETAQLKNSVSSSEQNKCKDLHALWERAKWGVSECCGTKEENLERVVGTKRGEEFLKLGVPLKFTLEIHQLIHPLSDSLGRVQGILKLALKALCEEKGEKLILSALFTLHTVAYENRGFSPSPNG
ncbi:uncharacterized protein TNCV_1489361 [Trichonephila clavipes]|nr:uncharacterized protein TNCV_1489361 [Trichonephila clavipes]